MSFWKDKKVLVTGHTGFVGTWMCLMLQKYGAKVIGLSLAPEENSLYDKIGDKLDIKSYLSDLRDVENVKKVFYENEPEIVIHLAAFGFVKECFEDPLRTFSSNIAGTVNLLETIRNFESVKSVLIVSSDKVYKNDGLTENILFDENDALGGLDIYSASKTCEDIVAQSYYDSYLRQKGICCNIVRPGNILGGGDHIKSRLIPSLLNGFETGNPIEIRNRDSIRPWQYILDALDAYLTVIMKTWDNCDNIGIYNVGPEANGQMTVGEISDYLQIKFSTESQLDRKGNTDGVKEAKYLGVSIDKISSELKWKPRMSMSDILDSIYLFWQNSKSMDIYEVCESQVNEYMSRM